MSRILTLNIGASKATLAEYSLGGKRNLTLTAYGSADLQAVDVNDALSISASLPPIISQIMREAGIRPAPVVVSLGGQMVFPRFAKFPAVGDKAKLEQLVHYEIEQNVPFPIDEIVSDHQFLGTAPDGDMAAMIVAAKLDGVRAVTDAIAAAGLKAAVVDVSPMAVLNALRFSQPQLAGCSVVLDIGSKTTNLILIEGEKIYNRSIPVAGNTITKEIAQTFGCSFEEAEQLKVERGYVALGGVMEDEDEITDRVSKIVRTVLTRLHAEISRSINFYRSQQGGAAPSRLFLTGGSVRLPQLDQFFMESLQVDVEYLNPFTAVRVGGHVNATALENDAFTLVESVGLALRQTDVPGLIRINLMPPELVAQARNVRRIPFLVVGAVGVLAALGLGILQQNRECDAAKAQLEYVQSQNNALSQKDKQLKDAQGQEKAEFDGCRELGKLMRGRTATLDHVRAVRKSILPGMWISKWEYVPPQGGDDADDGLDGVKVVVCGWKDSMKAELKKWKAAHEGDTSGDVATVIRKNLESTEGLVAPPEEEGAESVTVDLQTGPTIDEITLAFKFASDDPNPAQKKQKKRRGRK
ncbi:MAG: type IV pilus assembly protein PilM [Kiritimatiellae bacterium]|nr:type IV pilus assembly protein PilM [Kiritimatiellia bacterium]